MINLVFLSQPSLCSGTQDFPRGNLEYIRQSLDGVTPLVKIIPQIDRGQEDFSERFLSLYFLGLIRINS